jgi:hypothetical protein
MTWSNKPRNGLACRYAARSTIREAEPPGRAALHRAEPPIGHVGRKPFRMRESVKELGPA